MGSDLEKLAKTIQKEICEIFVPEITASKYSPPTLTCSRQPKFFRVQVQGGEISCAGCPDRPGFSAEVDKKGHITRFINF